MSRSRKVKKDAESRKRAEYLASLPKHPIKRFFYRLHPKRFWAYWFSKRGLLMGVKIAGVVLLLMVLTIGALFAYFRKDLDQIKPEELAKRVQTTTTKYYDRNGILLWEDKGSGNYKLAVESDELSDNLKKATVAIEDRDFYKHAGVSLSGTIRAVVNNISGGETQGGSTLTQQLVKQVFFSDESSDRSLGGVPRKIKEAILAIEVERTYSKDQILTLYLNESPYGGRRNGAESGARTYFGKSAKDLSIAEASLLAAIPQNPTVYDPYNIAGHTGLINRQHTVLNAMVEVGYITREQADEAKAYPILDHINPESDQYKDIKAPHFVQYVRSQLESELGTATVGQGGLSITTSLDYRIQQRLEKSMAEFFASSTPGYIGFTNAASVVEDSQTGQIVAMMGSRDFQYPGFGQDNATTAFLQSASTIKPFVFTELFEQKPEGQKNYGSGTVLRDEPINQIYGTSLNNYDRRFLGDITIRRGLAGSRNIPAVKAMYISGIQPTLETIHDMGVTSYCTDGVDKTAQLSAAIGGCGVKQTDLVNGYATIARNGVYKPQVTVLEVKNNSGEVLKKWTDTAGKQVVNPQSTYIVADILSDVNASSALGYYTAKDIPGVKTGTKTGTSDKDGSTPKDLWMMSFSPALTMGIWLGNPDASTVRVPASSIGSPVITQVMEYAHKDIYAKDGRWKSGDWIPRPAGIQQQGKELYPSWWNKTQGQSNAKLVFDRVSKRKATDATPALARIELDVVKSVDPVTKKDIYTSVPDGYNANGEDNVHKASDVAPSIGAVTVTGSGSGPWVITINVTKGTFTLPTSGVTVTINGTSQTVSGSGGTGVYTVNYSGPDPNGNIAISVVDAGYYQATKSN